MRFLLLGTALLISTGALISCATEADDDLTDSEAAEAGISGNDEGKADSISTTSTLYTLRQDDRRCRFPICGGKWLSRVNFERTKCADGSWAAECYVGAVDWTTSGLDPLTVAESQDGLQSKRVILRGKYGKGNAGEFGPYDIFQVREAYRGIADAAATGAFYFLNDNGVRCITSPCFSLHQAKVNSTRDRELSEFRMGSITASADDLATAYQQLSSERIIASGYNLAVRRGGVAMVPTQVFVRVKKVARDPLACASTDECFTTMYPTKVNSAADCYCPTCPTPIAVWAGEENQNSWNAVCVSTHGNCPARPCAPPPPVGCLAGGQCGFDFSPR